MSETESDNDEDLRRAIALSLEEPDSIPTRTAKAVNSTAEVINLLSSDEEEDDLDKPVTLKRNISKTSKTESKGVSILPGTASVDRSELSDIGPGRGSTSASDAVSGKTNDSTLTLLLNGLDRKAMEAERLARARKRKASISPPPSRDESKRNVRTRKSPSLMRK